MFFGRAGFGVFFIVLHLLTAGAFLYFMYNISKSLKKIADGFDKKFPPAIEGTQPQKIAE